MWKSGTAPRGGERAGAATPTTRAPAIKASAVLPIRCLLIAPSSATSTAARGLWIGARPARGEWRGRHASGEHHRTYYERRRAIGSTRAATGLGGAVGRELERGAEV